jgi:hypothetical protein
MKCPQREGILVVANDWGKEGIEEKYLMKGRLTLER